MHGDPSRAAGGGRLSSILGAVSKTQGQQGHQQGYPQMRGLSGATGELPRKRPREAEEGPPPSQRADQNPDRARLSVADYLKSKTAPPG